MGFEKENLIFIPVRESIGRQYDSFRNELLKNPGIADVTGGSGMPGGPVVSEWGQIRWEGKQDDEIIPMFHIAVDDNFIETFGMEIVQGRDFSKSFSSDTLNFILNEAAVKAIGLDNPLDTEFTLLFRTGTIVGIVGDYHIHSFRSEIRPVIMRMLPPRFWNYVFIRVQPGEEKFSDVIGYVKTLWKEYAPSYPFEFEFLDRQIDSQYRTEQRIGQILTYFTGLTVFIACLGLFGLASFMAEQRTKEIGIRKVLGSSVSEIILLLSREFSRWVIVANLFAWPIAYWIVHRLLRSYVYRVPIGLEIFLISGCSALLIAFLTVGYQALRAATANPVDAIKYE